jgi:16S rRNA (cytosine1407-C5)-methyltransferase
MVTIPDDFPAPFLERYERMLGRDGLDRILDGFTLPRQTWFRLNPLMNGSWDDLGKADFRVHRDATWPDAGWVSPDDRSALLASQAVRDGKVYVQGMASQLPVRMLDPGPDDLVLDLAAAPGSKTIQLAGLDKTMDIAAVEIVRKRKFRLDDNLSRHGADHVKVFLQDGTKVWRYRPEHFDAILLDAPCSSEGRFRLDEPESFAFWKRSKTKEMVRRQRRLLFSAVHALKPGGTLVYSTCSLAPEENEGVVAHALESFGSCLSIEPIAFEAPERVDAMLDWGKGAVDERVAASCRLMPSHRMEGFFVARFVKTESSNPPIPARYGKRR